MSVKHIFCVYYLKITSVNIKMSATQKVLEFTRATGFECPDKPRSMGINSVKFLIRMVSSELVELAQTVTDNYAEAVDMVQTSADCDLNKDYAKPVGAQLIADQADALVDIQYYMYNAAVKHGLNLDSVFDLVHSANMAKRFPDGEFHRRDDGKIIKPDGWVEPDVRSEIGRQIIYGSW